MIRILLVDDHKVVRLGLSSLLSTVPGFEVVGEAGTAQDAIGEALRTRPDIVLMDVRMPDQSGIEACREIVAQLPDTKVIILTSFPDEEAVISAIMAGASAYLLKHADPDEVIDAIEKVSAGLSLLDPHVTAIAMAFVRRSKDRKSMGVGGLSPKEATILALIAEGKTNRQIGEQLGLSSHTIKTYVSNIFNKLHLGRRSEAAAAAMRLRPRA